MSVIRTRDLCVDFGQPALRDVSVTVEAGEFVNLMGANGTGKTTLIKAVLGLTHPTSGGCWLLDTPTERFRDWPAVAYVPQHLLAASAVPVSVEEAVRSALVTPHRRWRVIGRGGRQQVAAALEKVGLADRAKDRLEDLSGGQQRRVMIARALATEPRLLIMDEPTAGVDAGEQARLAEHIEALHRNGVTILLITHDLGPVASLAQRAIVLGHPAQAPSVRYDGPCPPPARWTEHVWHHSDEQPDEPALLEGP